MGHSLFSWILSDGEGRSIVRDMRSGRAGALVRLGLSLAAAGMCLFPMFFVLGLIDSSGRGVRDHHIGMAMATAALLWGGSLVVLWWTYRRFRHAIRALIAVIAVWGFVIPATLTVEEMVQRADFLITSLIVGGMALTIAIVAITTYHGSNGRRIIDAAGAVRVVCPECSYSLVGLASTTCPECGRGYTVDEIIRAQGYQRDDEVDRSVETQGETNEVPASAEPVLE